jgi:drug/metabolite transporter (DMT)-like permease
MSPSSAQVFPILAVFFIFYTVQPLLMTSMKQAGVPKVPGAEWTFIFSVPNYYAMIPVGFLPSKSTLAQMTRKEWRTGCFLSALDLINQLMSKTGLMMTGAAMYMIINSSGMIWTVGLSMVVLGKRPSLVQCIGIAFVLAGLSFKVYDSIINDAGEARDNEDFATEMKGICMIVFASVLDGLTFVLIEKFQQGPSGIPGPQLTCMQGIFASTLLTIWTFFFTLSGSTNGASNFKTYIMDGISLSCKPATMDCIADNGKAVIYCLYLLFMANVFTSSTVWWLLANVGAVTFVVVKALKIIVVFASAHVMHCSQDPKECMSWRRAGCAALCVAGVVIYSLAPKNRTAKRAPEDEEEEEREESLVVTDAVGLSFASHGTVHRSRIGSLHSCSSKAGEHYQAC